MKLTVKEAMDKVGALAELSSEKHTNMVLMFRISHNLKCFNDVRESYGEAEKAAVEKYGRRNENGELDQTPQGIMLADVSGFTKAMEPLLTQEVEIVGLKTIPWSMLQTSTVEKDGKQVPLAIRGQVVTALGALLDGEPSEA